MDYYAGMRAFVRAVELGSFSKAAEESGVKVSTVSRYVSGLEADLGAAILNRSTRSLHLTEAELAKAGIAPKNILRMATTNAAEYLHRVDTMGSVEPGRNADLVVLNANPLEAVGNLQAIAGVVRAGTYYSSQDLEALRARVAFGRGYLRRGKLDQ